MIITGIYIPYYFEGILDFNQVGTPKAIPYVDYDRNIHTC